MTGMGKDGASGLKKIKDAADTRLHRTKHRIVFGMLEEAIALTDTVK